MGAVRSPMLAAVFAGFFAGLFVSASSAVAQERPDPRTTEPAFAIDRYLTPSVGALDIVSVQRQLASIEDRFVPLKLGSERTRLGLAAGIAYRAGKFIGLDVPQDHMLLVIQHEVFGHGARLRELGVGRIAYGFDAPIPYGEGGAVTSFSGEIPDTPLSFLIIESAGIEAQHTLADTIADRALTRGRLHYRDAWMYFESRYVALTYILDATESSEEGHDVADFAKTTKDACAAPSCTPVSLDDLQKRALWMLADPMLYYAIYGFASSYIGLGEQTSPIPMISLGPSVRYLPSVGFQMTPFGTEWLLRSAFVSELRAKGKGSNVTRITLRVGDTGATTPWGVDVHLSDVRVPRTTWHIRPSFSVWRQPFVLTDHTSDPLHTGAAASATFVVPFPRRWRSPLAQGVHVTAGAKSEGFIPGEQLSGGMILKMGLAIQLQ